MADMKNMTKMTITHTTTDLGLWWPYTDQGKPHGEKKNWGKLSMGKKTNTER